MTQTDWSRALDQIAFDAGGLIPVVAQQHDSGEVLMVAWMNKEAVIETLASGRVCYYSRSRKKLWHKGETSGQVQTLISLALDCDGDCLLAKVDQRGVACHTGRRSCFYREIRDDRWIVTAAPLIAPDKLYAAPKS